MSDKLPITCYIRTLNEERSIAAVIESVADFCSQIIVIDSGSNDQTIAIARSLGAKVIEQPWLGNGFQKRVGEDLAEHDWLLDLDADELVSAELQSNIRSVFEMSETIPYDVFSLKLVTITPIGVIWKHSCLAWRNKLYRKSIYRVPAHKAWDQFKIKDQKKLKKLDGDLYHHSFENFEHLIAKMNRVSSVRSREKRVPNTAVLVLRILFGFPIYFCKKYFYQRMFLTGIYGLVAAILMAAQRWFTDVKMYENILIEREKNLSKKS